MYMEPLHELTDPNTVKTDEDVVVVEAARQPVGSAVHVADGVDVPVMVAVSDAGTVSDADTVRDEDRVLELVGVNEGVIEGDAPMESVDDGVAVPEHARGSKCTTLVFRSP